MSSPHLIVPFLRATQDAAGSHSGLATNMFSIALKSMCNMNGDELRETTAPFLSSSSISPSILVLILRHTQWEWNNINIEMFQKILQHAPDDVIFNICPEDPTTIMSSEVNRIPETTRSLRRFESGDLLAILHSTDTVPAKLDEVIKYCQDRLKKWEES